MNPRAEFEAAGQLHAVGDLDGAEAAYRRVVGALPNSIRAYMGLGQVLQQAGRLEGEPDVLPDVFLRLVNGDVICTPRPFSQMTTYILLEQEDWFEDEIRFVRNFVGPDMNCIDIGANYGCYTLAMARATGVDSKVWAFEPTGLTARCLRRTLGANGIKNVELIPAALSDHTGTAMFYHQGSSETNTLQKPDSAISSEEVRVSTLDAMAGELAWPDIDFLKIDAEGAEEKIIAGGQAFLSSQSPLIMFEHKHEGVVNEGVMKALQALGYGFYRLIPGLGLLLPVDAGATVGPFQLNFFACKPDRAGEIAERGLLVEAPAEEGELPELDKNAWRDYLRSHAYFGCMEAAVEKMAAGEGVLYHQTHRRALNLYATAQKRTLSARERHACLRECVRILEPADDLDINLLRTCTFVRAALELGERALAVDALTRVMTMDMDRSIGAPAEPFLSPLERFDGLDPGDDFEGWIKTALLEQYIRAVGFSGYFLPEEQLSALDRAAESDWHSPETDRRRALMRFKADMNVPDDLLLSLAQDGPENRNAEFWRAIL